MDDRAVGTVPREGGEGEGEEDDRKERIEQLEGACRAGGALAVEEDEEVEGSVNVRQVAPEVGRMAYD